MVMLLGPLNCRPSMAISSVVLSLGCRTLTLALAVRHVQETRTCVISSGSFQMFVILKLCLSCAPRATTPKSCVVTPPNILSAQAGVCAVAVWDSSRLAEKANTSVRMLGIPERTRTPKSTQDSSVPSQSGEGGFCDPFVG